MRKNSKFMFYKTLILLNVLFTAFFIFQLTYASNISLSNSRIDQFVHHSQVFCGSVVIILFLSLLIIHLKNKWIKITLGIIILPISLTMLLGLTVVSYGMLAPSDSYSRFYFYEKDNFNYYVTSERFAAFSGGRELKYYKEKELVLFLKRRIELTETDIANIKQLAQSAADSLWQKYQR
jgi:hypothetical protein